MKKWFITLAGLGLAALIAFIYWKMEPAAPVAAAQTTETKSNFTVVLDPGHGGIDTGAVNDELEVYEKDYNLDIALAAKKQLEALGITVIMTRDTDEYLEVAERAEMANAAEADLFVSIHNDTNQDWGDGAHIIYSINEGPSLNLARQISTALTDETTQVMRSFDPIWAQTETFDGQIDDYYGVIRRSLMPAVIVETAYLNPANIQHVNTYEKRQAMGKAIADGIYAEISADFGGVVTYKAVSKTYDPDTYERIISQ